MKRSARATIILLIAEYPDESQLASAQHANVAVLFERLTMMN